MTASELTWPVADTDEISREGGLVMLTDTLGTTWRLTLEEAKTFPFGLGYSRCRLIDGYWYQP